MPDRIIRDELLESPRFISLKDNADRLAFIAVLLHADDAGNFEGDLFRLTRIWRDFGISTIELAAKTLAELADVDLVRVYEVSGKQYLHVPRFRQRIRYVNGKFPPPPDGVASCEIKGLLEKRQTKDCLQTDRGQAQVCLKTAEEKRSEVKRSEEKRSEANLDKPVSNRESGANNDQHDPEPRKRGTRLNPDWVLPDTWRAWAKAERPHWPEARIIAVAEAFRDHWLSKGEARADWAATWRNWVRRERDVVPARTPAQPTNIAAKRAAVRAEIWKHHHDPDGDIIGTAVSE